jgi:hypothetical protein
MFTPLKKYTVILYKKKPFFAFGSDYFVLVRPTFVYDEIGH